MGFKLQLKKHLKEVKTMQLATVDAKKPWISTVYFVADNDLNIYWLSFPSRRHSQEILKNPNVAIAIPVKLDRPVIGIQAEGKAAVFEETSEVKRISKLYIEKYDDGKDFFKNFVVGENKHSMYKLKPEKFVLFDEVNYKDKGPQILELGL